MWLLQRLAGRRALVVADRHLAPRVRRVRARRARRRGGGRRAPVPDAHPGGRPGVARRDRDRRRVDRPARHARRAAGARAPGLAARRRGARRGSWQAALVGIAIFVPLLAVGRDAARLRPRGAAASARVVRSGRDAAAQEQAAAGRPARALARPARPRPPRARPRAGGRRWPARAGRWLFDWLTLLTALAAVGQHPRPTLVLLAFCAAQLLAQIPITPGGLGVVEAGLTGFLVLIGVPASAAAVAMLAYRLVSYWLALPAGGAAYLYHRRRVRAGDVSVPRIAASSSAPRPARAGRAAWT